jgi:hypothetical protein
MQVKVSYLTDDEIAYYAGQQFKKISEAEYAALLGLFFAGMVEKPDPVKYGISQELDNELAAGRKVA